VRKKLRRSSRKEVSTLKAYDLIVSFFNSKIRLSTGRKALLADIASRIFCDLFWLIFLVDLWETFGKAMITSRAFVSEQGGGRVASLAAVYADRICQNRLR
jgi:hypothetical protein